MMRSKVASNSKSPAKLLGFCLVTLLTLACLIQETSAILDLSIADLIDYGNNQFSLGGRASRASSKHQQQHDGGNNNGNRCGYNSCPPTDDDKLNVHIIAHTHDDVGWLKTVDQYYYGTRKRQNIVGVRHILSSVVPQLIMDPRKRFIYVEMSFFYKWWDEQDEQMRDIVKQLVNEGRLEFINGGWCMNDEATVNYQSTIEQMTLGLKFLNETFGHCGHPKTGWQIDPFGHTSEQASLFAQFGFDSMFFSRISYEDKLHRRENKSLDIIWHADRALAGQTGSIYTNIMWDGYDAPPGFCFDAQCLDDEIVDNKKSYEYNIAEKAAHLITMFRSRAKQQLTNDLMIPFGGDFQFMAAEQNFLNIDKLIKYINEAAPDMNLFYSTPSCYAYSVYQHSTKSKISLPEKYDDFMPYDSTPTIWWSGYFSSRPSVKLIERQVADLLQLARLVSLNQLIEHSKGPNFSWSREVANHENQCLMPLWEILGDLQHHDAVTGTEKQHVADDYVRRAQDAINLCSKFIGSPRRQQFEIKMRQSPLYKKLAAVAPKYSDLEPVFLDKTNFCHSLNISQCEPLESNLDFHNSPHYKLLLPGAGGGDKSTKKLDDTTTHQHQPHHSSALSSSDDRDYGNPSVSVHSSDNHHHGTGAGAGKWSKATSKDYPTELETRAVLMHAYNPYGHEIKQQDFRLPCIGMCDLTKIKVIQLANNASLQLVRLPVPAGILALPFRDAFTTFEILFYADLPPIGYTSLLIEDTNTDDIIDEELDVYDPSSASSGSSASPAADQSIESRRESKTGAPTTATVTNSNNNAIRQKRIKRQGDYPDYNQDHDQNDYEDDDKMRFEYFSIGGDQRDSRRSRRDLGSSSSDESNESEKIVVKFDLQAGMIVGLKRVSDGSALNISQKFGYYYPVNYGPFPGAYIFRPNTTEPQLMEKPVYYKMYKRKNGALVEIHQKWSDWIWQTIRVDSKKNYIEFDYVIGPIPLGTSDSGYSGREIVTRYVTDMKTDGVFMTDSNARQLLIRKSKFPTDMLPENLGSNFYPVVSTIMLKNTKDQEGCNSKCKAEAVSVLVDRPQAGTSLHDGQLELLVHRRLLKDDNFGVGEALNEPGEDGRGLVTRGKHRLFLRFPKNNAETSVTTKSTPRPVLFKLPIELSHSNNNNNNAANSNDNAPTQIQTSPSYLVQDQLLNDLSQESRKYTLRPVLTFDRLRVTSNQFIEMLSSTPNQRGYSGSTLGEYSLLNSTLPSNIHLLTIQPWLGGTRPNQILIRLENLDNPLLIHPVPDHDAYTEILGSYEKSSTHKYASKARSCDNELRPRTSVETEYLIRGLKIVKLDELSLGANTRLSDVKRLNFTGLPYEADDCERGDTPTVISLAPRQIRTMLATFEAY